MATSSSGGTVASYVYDDAGNRVQQTVNGTTTYYLTDNANPTGYAQPLEQKASLTATPTETYLIGDRVFGQVNASSVVSYLLADGHGSTEQMTSSTGSVTTAFRYDAFGGGINFTLATAPTIFLFGGDAVYDPASGLYLHGDGVRGRAGFRFIEADVQNNGSTSDPLSIHKYLYSNADPLNEFDPSGHDGTLIETLFTVSLDFGLRAEKEAPAAPALTVARGAVGFASLYSRFALAATVTTTAGTTALAALYSIYQTLQGVPGGMQAVGNAIKASEDLALKSTTLTRSQVEQLPIFYVFQRGLKATPDIYKNDSIAINGNPPTQEPAHPGWVVLNYLGAGSPQKDLNRRAALAAAGARGIVAGPNQSLDEYPYASTREGGAVARVAPVPVSEQDIQKNALSAFYNTQLNAYKAGTFLVVLVP